VGAAPREWWTGQRESPFTGGNPTTVLSGGAPPSLSTAGDGRSTGNPTTVPSREAAAASGEVFRKFVRHVLTTPLWLRKQRLAAAGEMDTVGILEISCWLAALQAAGVGGGSRNFPYVLCLSGPCCAFAFAAVWAGLHAASPPATTRRMVVVGGNTHEESGTDVTCVGFDDMDVTPCEFPSTIAPGIDSIRHLGAFTESLLNGGREQTVSGGQLVLLERPQLLVIDLIPRHGSDEVYNPFVITVPLPPPHTHTLSSSHTYQLSLHVTVSIGSVTHRASVSTFGQTVVVLRCGAADYH
jgi:hypothetical protein